MNSARTGLTPPDLIITCATIGRLASLASLIDSLADEARRSAFTGQVALLVVHNEPEAHPTSRAQYGALLVHHADIRDVRPHLVRCSQAGVLPPPTGTPPWSIGHAREAQIAFLRRHLGQAVLGLPHPGNSPVAMWMVDDDISFSLPSDLVNGQGDRGPLWRAAHHWATLPADSVVLGAFVGDPPIPGPDSWRGQLFDIAASLRHMLALGPGGLWEVTNAERRDEDYYDLADNRGRDENPVYYAAGGSAPVRQVAKDLLGEVPRLLDGRQLTRPLLWDGEERPPRPSLRRGGNALFLDPRSLFRWPTPVLRCADGVDSRRADTLWATLAQREAPGVVVEATLPLLHGRAGQVHATNHTPDGSTLGRHATAQARGVAIARSLLRGTSVAEELTERRKRVMDQRAAVIHGASSVLDLLDQLESWENADVSGQLVAARDAIRQLRRRAGKSIPAGGHHEEIQAFVDELPAAVQRWRRCW